MNDKPGVAEETRLKVKSVAEKLNYIPNNIARSLVTRRTHSIGLIVADISEPFFSTLAKIIQDAVNAVGYRLILCNSDNKPVKENSCLDLLLESGVDGIVMVPCSAENGPRISSISLPIVFLDCFIPGSHISYVGIDNENAGYTVTEHFIKMGHRRIACVAGPKGATSSELRIRGWMKALRTNGLPVNDLYLKHTDWSVESGFSAAREIFSLKDLPTAVFVMGDMSAIGVFEALNEKNIQVPDDVAIVGFDDIQFSRFFKVPLSTVRQPMSDLGNQAAQILVEAIRSRHLRQITERKEPVEVILKPELIIRDSCGYSKQQSTLTVDKK
jgi:LacI family transcriptional regulator